MDYDLIIARSVTHAQRMLQILQRNGLNGTMLRSPVELTDRGCSYAVRIQTELRETARETLRGAGLTPLRWFTRENAGFREVGG